MSSNTNYERQRHLSTMSSNRLAMIQILVTDAVQFLRKGIKKHTYRYEFIFECSICSASDVATSDVATSDVATSDVATSDGATSNGATSGRWNWTREDKSHLFFYYSSAGGILGFPAIWLGTAVGSILRYLGPRSEKLFFTICYLKLIDFHNYFACHCMRK